MSLESIQENPLYIVMLLMCISVLMVERNVSDSSNWDIISAIKPECGQRVNPYPRIYQMIEIFTAKKKQK